MELGLKDRLPQAKSLGFAVTVSSTWVRGRLGKASFPLPPPKQILSLPLFIRSATYAYNVRRTAVTAVTRWLSATLWYSCHHHFQAGVFLVTGPGRSAGPLPRCPAPRFCRLPSAGSLTGPGPRCVALRPVCSLCLAALAGTSAPGCSAVPRLLPSLMPHGVSLCVDVLPPVYPFIH